MHGTSVPPGESTQVSPASIFLANNRSLQCVYLTSLACLDNCCSTGVDDSFSLPCWLPHSRFFFGGGVRSLILNLTGAES